ncbi:hypothetical protein BMS3Bbin14_01165 [bacterium BMS3Bbin14]|nr:hypothetical protein BMS3Abin13_01440 [bacterium BMS3Abin13]GBE52690.1 hypothetical protein BMS3Bbin14_01165 [bacterium BMS3Bbin14]
MTAALRQRPSAVILFPFWSLYPLPFKIFSTSFLTLNDTYTCIRDGLRYTPYNMLNLLHYYQVNTISGLYRAALQGVRERHICCVDNSLISHQDNQHRCRLASAPFPNTHGSRLYHITIQRLHLRAIRPPRGAYYRSVGLPTKIQDKSNSCAGRREYCLQKKYLRAYQEMFAASPPANNLIQVRESRKWTFTDNGEVPGVQKRTIFPHFAGGMAGMPFATYRHYETN